MVEPYYDRDGITIYHGDCREILPQLDKVDLVLTSPPYDNLREYGGYTFDFDTIAPMLYEVVIDNGVMVWIVGDATINGSETGTSFKQALKFKDCGFNLHDTMIYRKVNFIPLTHNRYEQEFEYMFVFSKGKPKSFNPFMKPNKLSGQTYNTKRPRSYDGHAIRHYRDATLQYKDKSIRGNVFDYIVGAGNDITNHPAPFPNKLAKDHIISWSNSDDTVLDPFLGSGTTAVACKILGRKCIGIEIEEKYCEIAVKRLAQSVMRLE